MSSSAKLREKLIITELDMEDTKYLQQGILSLVAESEDKDDFQNNNNEPKKRSPLIPISHDKTSFDWMNKLLNSTNLEKKEFDYKHVFSPIKNLDVGKNVFQSILHQGVDKEDIAYLEASFQSLLLDPSENYWTSDVLWSSHPPTADEKTEIPATEDHTLKTGSARTEGYFKIDKLACVPRKGKRKYSALSETINSVATPYSKRYKANKQDLSRDARNEQRRLSTAYESITHSDLLKLNQLKFRKKKLRLGKSEIHGLGIFTTEPIAPNEIIIEYVGQIIRPIIADLREKTYKSSGIGSYCFRIDENTIIDATKLGNLNRYINHSCSPNSYAKIMVINNRKKIVIYSKKFIKVDEEITYDYKMSYEDEKITCYCRAPNCRKYLN